MADDSSKPEPTITCAENGPYLVKGMAGVTGPDGALIEGKKVMALCRCGGSKMKPFCDGTHTKNGFSGAKESDRVADRRDSYVGQGVTIHDNRGLCAHAGACTDHLATVWRMRQEPWIDPDGGTVEAVIETIRSCPSGALSYSIDGQEHRDQDRDPEIHVIKGGPYKIVGGVNLEGEDWGDGASREHYTLCRCGHSKNKPFCDGSHWNVKFDTDEAQ